MKIRQFYKCIQHAEGVKGLACSEIEKLPFRRYNALIKLTSLIKFSCIIKDNSCGRYPTGNMRLCCANCRETVGHFTYLPRDKSILKVYAKKFHNRYGFWRPQVGCTLPLGWRSIVCVCFNCHEQLESVDKIYPEAIANFILGLRRSKEERELIEELRQPFERISVILQKAAQDQKKHTIDYSPFFEAEAKERALKLKQ